MSSLSWLWFDGFWFRPTCCVPRTPPFVPRPWRAFWSSWHCTAPAPPRTGWVLRLSNSTARRRDVLPLFFTGHRWPSRFKATWYVSKYGSPQTCGFPFAFPKRTDVKEGTPKLKPMFFMFHFPSKVDLCSLHKHDRHCWPNSLWMRNAGSPFEWFKTHLWASGFACKEEPLESVGFPLILRIGSIPTPAMLS